MSDIWYSYILLNPLKPSSLHPLGFEPFYVGKGKGARSSAHTQDVKRGLNEGNMHKINTIRKILVSGLDPIVSIECTFNVEQEAYDHEKFLIKFYGRADLKLGPLTNMTDGGEGPANRVLSEQHKLNLSKAQSAALAGGRAVVSRAFIEAGLKAIRTPEAILKSAIARTGREVKQSTKDAIGESQRQFAASLNEEQRKEHYGTMKGKKLSEDSLLKLSASLKETLNHPEVKAKRSAALKGLNAKPCEVLGVQYESVNAAIAGTGLYGAKLRSHPTFRYLK